MIKLTVHLKAAPNEIYEALMDEKIHGDFTNAKAKIENKVGGKFSVWDDYATGENLELISGKKIVQSWKASDWERDAVSKVTFTLKSEDGGCELDLVQEDVPREFEDEIEQGWKDYYFKPLKEYLKKQ